MATKANVVLGEAPESDSEDELNVSNGVHVPSGLGRVMPGEAPESDEETIGKSRSIDSVSSAMSASSITVDSGKKKSGKDVSLLTKKLCERNVSLAKNVSELVTHTVVSASNELNTVDQHLLKCQVQVQEAENILKSINANVATLEAKLRSLLSHNYVPMIVIPENV